MAQVSKKELQKVIGEDDDSSITLYERLHTKAGQRNAWNWFKRKCEGGTTMDENALINFFRLLTKRIDYEILDIIDIFDDKFEGSLSWDSFFLVLALYSALACNQTVKFLHNHGTDMYHILTGHGTSELDFQRFASFAFILGIPEEDLVQSIVNDFKVNGDRLREQPINSEDFFVYYFSTLKKLDEHGTVLQYSAQDLLKNSPLCACIIS